MKRILPLLLLLSLGLLWTPAPAEAQPTDFLRDSFGYGEGLPLARILFYEEGDDQLCVILGLSRQPKTPRYNSFFFNRRVKPKKKGFVGRLNFEINKEPDSSNEGFLLRHACVPTPGPATDAKDDNIEITLRGGEIEGSNAKFFVRYPEKGRTWGLDFRQGPSGGIVAEGFVQGISEE